MTQEMDAPEWVGFLWTPRHTLRKSLSLEQIKTNLHDLHRQVCGFYAGKDKAVHGIKLAQSLIPRTKIDEVDG